MSKKLPWYKRYPNDFMGDPYVQAMTAEQYGWFSAMLDASWIHTPIARLPNDFALICKMIGRCDELYFTQHSKIVIERFKVSEDGKWLYHPRMLEQAEKLSQTSQNKSHPGKSGRKKTANKPESLENQNSISPKSDDYQNEIKQRGDSDSDSDKRKGSDSQPLSLRELAHAICQVAQLPATNSNLDVVQASIEAIAGNKISNDEAANKLLVAVEARVKSGERLNRFYFENGGYNKPVEPPKPATPKPLPVHLRMRAQLEEDRKRVQ